MVSVDVKQNVHFCHLMHWWSMNEIQHLCSSTHKLHKSLSSSYGFEDGRCRCQSPKKCQTSRSWGIWNIYNAYPSIDRYIQLPLKLHVYKNKSDLPTAFVSSFGSEKW